MLRAIGFLLVLIAGGAAAQSYPDRVVRFLVPFSAGGVSDVVTRAVAQKLGTIWRYAPIVENRPGAGSTLGAAEIARAKPDGYHLLLTGNTHLVSAALYRRLAFDAVNDFIPIIVMAEQSSALVVHPSVAARNVAELVALAKAQPGKFNYASSGNGSSQHLFMALFTSMAGVEMTHVPYKGSGPATADLLSGLVPVSLPSVSNILQHVQSAKLRALAVSGKRRIEALPDVPTLDEAGIKGYEAQLWFCALGPKGMSDELVKTIADAIAEATRSPEVKKAFAGQGIDPFILGPAEFAKFYRAEAEKWARIVKAVGVTVD